MPGAFDAANILSYLLVFLEGVLSFFSPCVLPLLPIYISYLAGNAKQTDDQGNVTYKQKKVFFHTVCFVLGISFAFFLLGLSIVPLWDSSTMTRVSGSASGWKRTGRAST